LVEELAGTFVVEALFEIHDDSISEDADRTSIRVAFG
jgi:hypothetical protein